MLYHQLLDDIYHLAETSTGVSQHPAVDSDSATTDSESQDRHRQASAERDIDDGSSEVSFEGFQAREEPHHRKAVSAPFKKAILPAIIFDKAYKASLEYPSRLELWQFLLHNLQLEKHKELLSWISRSRGQFRVHDPKGLAQLWGKYRGAVGDAMTFAKLSRALRYYYRRDILKRSDARLVYVFTDAIMAQL